MWLYVWAFLICSASVTSSAHETLSKVNEEEYSMQEKHYLIYDVNPGEGFNLRRDVYMRVANVVRLLREKGHNYVLVLPPWRYLYHWRRTGAYAHKWEEFFDVDSLNQFIPVLEFDTFIAVQGGHIEQILYLQPYAEGWEDGEFQLKYDVRPCINELPNRNSYYKVDGKWTGHFLTDKAYADNLQCLSIQGQSSTLADAILEVGTDSYAVLVDRAETILHDRFGDVHYWQARRSMRYVKPLRVIADKFR
jgi:peptide-O-fucosyltransferase